MHPASKCGMHLDDFLSFTVHEEYLLPVSDPHYAVRNHGSPQPIPYVHGNPGHHTEHMVVHVDNEESQDELTLANCQNKLHCSHVSSSAHLSTANADQQWMEDFEAMYHCEQKIRNDKR